MELNFWYVFIGLVVLFSTIVLPWLTFWAIITAYDRLDSVEKQVADLHEVFIDDPDPGDERDNVIPFNGAA